MQDALHPAIVVNVMAAFQHPFILMKEYSKWAVKSIILTQYSVYAFLDVNWHQKCRIAVHFPQGISNMDDFA